MTNTYAVTNIKIARDTTIACLNVGRRQTNERTSLDNKRYSHVKKKFAAKRTRGAKIARTLKRPEGATRQKAFSLGLSL